jgi:hypothetical protein
MRGIARGEDNRRSTIDNQRWAMHDGQPDATLKRVSDTPDMCGVSDMPDMCGLKAQSLQKHKPIEVIRSIITVAFKKIPICLRSAD